MKPLGPDEGINALRHPDCRACTERERLSLGQLAAIDALKAKLAPVEDEARQFKRQRDELLAAVEAVRVAPSEAAAYQPENDLVALADRIRAATSTQLGEGER